MLVPLKVFSLKRFTPGVCVVRFRGLGRKSETGRRKCVVLELGERADGGWAGDLRPRQRKRFMIHLRGCDEHPGRLPRERFLPFSRELSYNCFD